MEFSKGRREEETDSLQDMINGVDVTYRAIVERNIRRLEYMLKNENLKSHIDCELICGLTALQVAIKCLDMTIANLLLENGADVNLKDNKGNTYLHVACETGDIAIVKLFLKHIDINALNNDGQTPLFVAVKKNKSKLVKYLLKQNADVNAENCWGPLHEAVENAYFDILEDLLSYDADTNQMCRTGFTPFHRYFRSFPQDNGDVLDLFLLHGADVNIKSSGSQNVLHLAAQHSTSNVFLNLMTKMDVNEASDLGMTTLHWVMESEFPRSMSCEEREFIISIKVNFLFDFGADVNAVNEKGHTPLYVAAEKGFFKVVECLLKLGADINGDGKNLPILGALKNENIKIVEFLINCGAIIDFNDLDFLLKATLDASTTVMKYMLENGSIYDPKSLTGYQIFVQALAQGNKEIAQYMLNLGADVNYEHENQLPIHHAFGASPQDYNTYNEIISILIKHIALMVSMNSYIHDTNLKLIKSDEKRLQEYNSYLKELTKMQNETICGDHGTTYYDVLTKLDNVTCCFTCEITNISLISIGYKRLFPHYGEQIESTYLKKLKELRKADKVCRGDNTLREIVILFKRKCREWSRYYGSQWIFLFINLAVLIFVLIFYFLN